MIISKDTLLEARVAVELQTALITLKSQYRNDKNKIWIVVEGKNDPDYYLNTIIHLIPRDWQVITIEAGNKKNVITVYKAIDWKNYSQKKILFFVDRDLSDFINDIDVSSTNFYVTDGYSIENSFITDEVMFRVLGELLGLYNLTSHEREAICELFKTSRHVFIKNMLIVMSIILCIEKHEIKTKGLNNIDIRDIFRFSQGSCVLKKTPQEIYNYVLTKLQCKGFFTEEEIEICKNEFSSHKNYMNLIRGKYMLSFLVLFVKSIRDDWNKFIFATTLAQKRNIDLTIQNAFVNVSVRARTVPSLRNFYIASVIGNWLK